MRWMPPSGVQVGALYVYPVKSCAGTPLEAAEVGPRGIVHDREFMLTDADGRFVTQREFPRLALVRPTLEGDCLGFTAPGMPPMRITPTDDGRRREVVV